MVRVGLMWLLAAVGDVDYASVTFSMYVFFLCLFLFVFACLPLSCFLPPPPLPLLKALFHCIHRNISSAGYEARKKLRECRGLVNALIHTLQMAHDEIINCKPVENVVCTLRNLSYRIQEMEDPDFYKKRSTPRSTPETNKGASIVHLKCDFYLDVCNWSAVHITMD